MIPSAECLTDEFKSDQKTISDNVIVEEVVALANTEGGRLYIGIEDDGVITGAQECHRDKIRLLALISNKTVPPVSARAELIGEDLPVMCIEVPKSISVVATSGGKILRRKVKADGSPETAPMYPHEISSRLSDLGRLDFSAQPLPDATRDDFNSVERERLRQLVQKNPNSDQSVLGLADEELERALRLTVSVGGRDVPTLAGMLLIGKEESIRRLVPTYEGVFQVLVGTEIKVNTSYHEPLLYTIEKIAESIEPWNPSTEISYGLFTEATPLFDRRSIREALVNAFGHRDYSMLGRVIVQIDDGGLQVSNPGGFIEGISVKNLLTAEPRGRNPCLMDALKRIGLAERTGRGIDRIFEGSLLYGKPLPDYSATNSSLVSLFIPRSEPDRQFVNLLAEEAERGGRPLPLQSLMVLDKLKRERRCTIEELGNDLDIPTARLRQTIEVLVEAGLVEASGVGKNRSYTLGRKVYKRSHKAKEYVRQTDVDRVRYPEMILKLAQHQERITTADVMDLLHLDQNAAYYEVSKLVKQGKLQGVRKGRNSYYTLAL